METRKVVQQLSSGKAPGADAIPAEVYNAGGKGLSMAEKLTEVCHCMWRKEAIPQEFKDASIVGKKINKSVTSTEVSLSYALLGRYWQNSVEPPECSS